ncbi:TAFII55 protein conserved region-domain-containing protein [Cladochytrium replicatum]|nr:TAFII55 protein conserved region-domain-containing protein [Cladochytrium replicatum]
MGPTIKLSLGGPKPANEHAASQSPNPGLTSAIPESGAPKNKIILKAKTGAPKFRLKAFKEDDEYAPIEEHLILRMPRDENASKFREAVKTRQLPPDLSMTFTDSRHGYLKVYGQKYGLKLVDLPCIIETQKTFDNKQFFKSADIAQMIVAEESGESGRPKSGQQRKQKSNGDREEYTWPDGITPPLKNCRKRRFRKRISKNAIEVVESEVERLLKADLEAEDVMWEEVDNRADEPDMNADQPQLADMDVDMGLTEESNEMLPTPGEEDTQMEQDDPSALADDVASAAGLADESEDSDDGLAAVIEEALDEDDEDEDDDDDDDDDEDDAEEDDNEEKSQLRQECEILAEEVAELDTKLEEKTAEAARQQNPIMKRRFEDIVTRLSTEVEVKRQQLATLRQALSNAGRNEQSNQMEDTADMEGEVGEVEDQDQE